MRKTIALMTHWYPTRENPFFGRFFREQILALEDRFDFLVIHYREEPRKKPFQQPVVRMAKKEKNIAEFEIDAFVPLALAARNRIHRGKTLRDTPERLAWTEKQIGGVFQAHFQSVSAIYCVDAQKEAFYGAAAAKALSVPLLLSEHGPVPWPGEAITEANQKAIEGADAFLAISRDKIRQLMMQGILLPPVTEIGNLVDEHRWPLADRSGHKEKTLLAVASHSFYKNYPMLLRVLGRLAEITDVPFHMIIAGYAANPGYAENPGNLEAQIKSAPFADRTELIPSLPHEQLNTLYARADALIITSIQEGQPVSALEAACTGLPLFTTRCGGVEDYTDDLTGRLYGITEEEAMAQGLKDFVEGKIAFDPAVIRRRVVEKYGWDAFRNTFAAVVDEVAHG